MRVTSPPKYHKQTQKSKSPFKTQPNQPHNNSQPVVHHLRSPPKISTQTLTKTSLKSNLYSELKNRQHQYAELIKDLHQQNKNLKQQIVRLQHQQSYPFNHQSTHLSPGRASLNQTLHHTTTSFYPGKIVDNQKIMNRTFSNFTSPQKIIEVNNIDNHTLTTNRSPFSKKPCIMSNTSPDGFRPVSTLRNNSPCVRPVSNYNLNKKVPQTHIQIRTVNNSYQPSLMSYNVSKNQSLQSSPKKNLQIIHVLNTAVKTKSPNKIVFKQTDDSKQKNQSHLNPLTSKRHQASKSVKIQSPEKNQELITQKQKPQNDNLNKKIEQNSLLNMLKQRIQQGDFLNSQMKQQSIQESQCLEFIKPSEYNHNIRFSSDRLKKQGTQPTHIIHPLKRNILEGFPILNQLRMANSQYQQQGEIPVHYQLGQTQNIINVVDHKTKDSFNVRSEVQNQSRLSAKISRQSESQSLIEQLPKGKRPLTIIKMLEQNLNIQSQSHSIIGKTNYESHQSIQSQTNIQMQKQNHSVHFVQIEKDSIQNIVEKNQIGNENQIKQRYDQNKQSSVKEQQLSVKEQQEIVKQQQLSVQEQQQIVRQQQEIVRPAHFSNRYYCQQTEQDIKIESQKSINQKFNQEKQSVKATNKKVFINEDKNISKVLSSKKLINQPQFSLHFDQPSKQEKSFDNRSQVKDQSIEMVQDQALSYQQSFVRDPNRMNQTSNYHLTYINGKDSDKLNSSISSQLNKTSPTPFYPQKQVLQSRNKKYLDANSLASNQYPSSSTLKSQKFKKISNQAYL